MGTAGKLDNIFPHGLLYGFDKNVHDVKIQSDGKILVAGDFEHYDYNGVINYSPYLCRLNVDGTFDTTFDITDGSVGLDNSIKTIHVLSNGKIIVGGEFTQIIRSGITYNYSNIIMFNTDGSINTSFNVGTGFNDTVETIEELDNGKIVVGGRFTQYSGQSYNCIIQLNIDGSVDTSFNIGTGFNDTIPHVTDIIKDGNDLLVGGTYTSYNGTPANDIIRLLSNGDIDTSFNAGTGFNGPVFSIGLQSTGKIIVGGYFTEFNGIDLHYGNIVRLNSDGSYSDSFGYGLDNIVTSICVQPNDKIIAGGFFDKYYTSSIDFIESKKLIKFLSTTNFDNNFYLGYSYSNGIYSVTPYNGDDYLFIGGEMDFPPFNHFGKLINEAPIPISANTEYFMCSICSGDTNTIRVPHPIYSNSMGRDVIQLNAIALGGEYGLNN